MKKILLSLLLVLPLAACATVGDTLYNQKTVDASGPTPEWVKNPEKFTRLELEKGKHVYIGHAKGKSLDGLEDPACGSAVTQAKESGIQGAEKLPVSTYWKRTRGMAGDYFFESCEIETARSK